MVVCLSVCLFVCLSVCSSVNQSACPPVWLSVSLCLFFIMLVCLSACLSVCFSIYMCISLYVCLYNYLFIFVSLYWLACLSICLSDCLFVYLSVWPILTGKDKTEKNTAILIRKKNSRIFFFNKFVLHLLSYYILLYHLMSVVFRVRFLIISSESHNSYPYTFGYEWYQSGDCGLESSEYLYLCDMFASADVAICARYEQRRD